MRRTLLRCCRHGLPGHPHTARRTPPAWRGAAEVRWPAQEDTVASSRPCRLNLYIAEQQSASRPAKYWSWSWSMSRRRDRRGSLSASSSGTRTPEPEHRFAWSPAWSRPLSEGRGTGSSRVKSLFRSIGLWFSSVSNSSRKKRIKKPPPPPLAPAGQEGSRPSLRGLYNSGYLNGRSRENKKVGKFSMEEILRATNNFSPALKIGQGGFGCVYRGVLPDGTAVAVKRGKLRMQNPHVDAEFRSEVRILARIEHQSLVRFYGYLECGEERVVVVEHVPNGTLRDHLDAGTLPDLATRLDIAIDVAHAVTYLHMYSSDHPIIHRDIKSSNILLTRSLRAKVADFGFARLGAALGLSEGPTHVSTQVKGTAGYLDPEYLKTCRLTDRSDVYSFGVLLVELVSGRRPIETKRQMRERLTARWAMARFIDGAAADVLDPCVPRTPAAERALEMLLELAFRCMGPVRNDRPPMSDCCRALWAVRKTYRDMLAQQADSSHTADHDLYSSRI